MRLLLFICLIGLFSACGPAKEADDANLEEKDKTEEPEEPAPPVETKITFSGTLVLSTDVPSDQADGLTSGGAIDEATIFLKGFSDEPVISGPDGTFSLAIDVSEAPALLDATNHTVLMWKTTETSSLRFGTSKKMEAKAGDTIDLGEISLTYTNAIHFSVKDSSTNSLITSDCTVTVDGFGDKIPTVKKSAGKYDSSYMPPDDYDFSFVCVGYETKVETVTVLAATTPTAWMSHSLTVTAK